jgi:hypothetical protein
MPANKTRIRELRDWAQKNLAQKIVVHDVFGRPITFSMGGIKEYLNQPHKHYQEKNELIKDMENVLSKSSYMGHAPCHSDNTLLISSHIFEIKILNEPSWLIARENISGEIYFYSISDNKSVLNWIIKK